jgi:small neutral amino acid transporter SnatA (MarC family)
MTEIIRSAALLLVLLNPFLVIVDLVDLVEKLEDADFNRVLLRAAMISTVVFWCFVILGDAIFSSVIQAEFGSFQVFGGIVFLLIGLQFVFRGPKAIEILQGESQHVAGAVAMPVMIGPGTISASVVIGERHSPVVAMGVVLVTIIISVIVMMALKKLHDFVRPRNEALVQRYIEIAGRIAALFVGTVAVEMIMQGLSSWMDRL